MNDEFKNQLLQITDSKSVLVWAKHIPSKYPDLYKWIIDITSKYLPSSLTESIFIILNGPPQYCQSGNKPKFISYNVGYQKFCKQGCYCFRENAAIKSKEVASNRTTEEMKNIFDKVADTCLKRYGYVRATAAPEIIEKMKATNIERYGHSSYIGSEQYKEYSLEKYGVTHPVKSKSVRDKISETCLSRYGVSSSFGSSIVREKSKRTNLARYGNIDHMQNIDVKKKMINSCLASGKYFRLEDKSDWYIYNTLAHFSNGFSDLVNSENDRALIADYGIYSSANKSGLVRDHIYSRRDGYDNQVFFEILKHPANCQLIQHKDNCSKKSKSNISLNELFDRIRGYKFSYHDHDVVIRLIDRYILGERFDIEKFKSIIGG